MNVPLHSREAPCASPMSCFCKLQFILKSQILINILSGGQTCPPESYYCCPDCAREDAFNALTLGKPHESSKPPMAPLPTLPPGFFKLPPKRKLHEADELVFMGDDHGPFQASQPSRSTDRNRKTRAPRSVPRSISTTSVASTAPSKRSEWRSHYRKTQQLDPTSIPLFLVEKADTESSNGHDQEVNGLSPAESLGIPTPTESRQQGADLVRIGSFGIITGSLAGTEVNTLMPYDDSPNQHRSSASSYNSLLTSGTSRSSYTSVYASSDISPTKSTHRTSFPQSQPRLGYGSAFGGHDDKPLALDVAKMVADLRDSMLVAKRASRKRSSTDATAKPLTREGEQTVPLVKEQPQPVPKDVPPPKKASTSVPKSHWPYFGITPSRSEQRLTTIVAPTPLQPQAVNTATSHPVLGTVVKKTTTASKGRLPIGTPQQVPPRPKTPSNVLPAGINLSIQSRSFCAPAYAMSAPKIPGSTRPLRTSPSKKSLKQKEAPSAEKDELSVEEGFKRSFEPTVVTETQDSVDSDVLVVNEVDATSSAQTGSRFTLCNAPKPLRETKTFRPTLTVDPCSTASPDIIPRPSPAYAEERSPSTAGGPLTPRTNTPVLSRRPVWLSPPSDLSNKAGVFMAAMQRTTRLGSNASDPGSDAQVCVAQKMKMQTSPSFLRSAFDWRTNNTQ